MKNTNVEYLSIFRNKGKYGYTVRYKSGRHKTVSTDSPIILPRTLHEFMMNAPYSMCHNDNETDYHDVYYYNRDIRTQSAPN